MAAPNGCGLFYVSISALYIYKMNIAVIGGGAAGFFSALKAKESYPEALVSIFEKSSKVLAKVKVSGGGRCNVTNSNTSIALLSKAYPRGGKQLKKAFQVFSTTDTIAWFKSRGVELYAQQDERMFPTSDDSQTIVDCFLQQCSSLGVEIKMSSGVKALFPKEEGVLLKFKEHDELFDKVIVATGGSPTQKGFDWLAKVGHTIVSPVPSLFTFNMPNEAIVELMGLVAPEASINIQGSKLKSTGPILITHWGMSGPAVLKLSAFAARELNALNYDFIAQVSWINESNQEKVKTELLDIAAEKPNKLLRNTRPFQLPERLWKYLMDKCEIAADKKWSELSKKSLNKLLSVLCNDAYQVSGKTTFKEEFVTAGGIDLAEVNFSTMQSKLHPRLYFAGEVLDIDGITGGYNFQSAWTTAFIAGQLKEA